MTSTTTAPPRPTAAPSARRLAGRFHLDSRTGVWSWSAETAAILGLPARGTQPCPELLVRAQHPADRARTLEAIAAACADGTPFSLQVRLRGHSGEERAAVLMGEPVVDATGAVEAVEGLLVEVPGRPSRPADPEQADRVAALETEVAQLRTAMGSRAPIEQAKGILMLLTSCGEQVAFDLLAHISSNCHRKVRDIAVAIADSASGRAPLPPDVRALVRDVCPPGPSMH
jgi:ANTAR domain/PAS fold